MHSLLKLQHCNFRRRCCGFGSEDYFPYMYLSTLFGFGINKQRMLVCLLLSYCNLSLRIGKLPKPCVQNGFLFPPRPKQLKARHLIASCSVHSSRTALKPFKES